MLAAAKPLLLFLIINVDACNHDKPPLRTTNTPPPTPTPPAPSTQRCCPEIEQGYCFLLKNNPPSNDPNPKCPSSFYPIRFWLFTQALPNGVDLSKNNIPSAFSNIYPTVIIVHGWSDEFYLRYQIMKDHLLAKGPYQVIGVDWKLGANSYDYYPSAANTQTMGAYIGSLVNILRAQPGPYSYMWCIGHGLGAHVCGQASLTTERLMDRITGLDPMGPYFGGTKGILRNRANNVDIIHTDPVFGLYASIGDVDFFSNFGLTQPGCRLSTSIFIPGRSEHNLTEAQRVEIMQRSVTERGDIRSCSHIRALDYMIYSMRDPNCHVATYECPDIHNLDACMKITGGPKGVMGYEALANRYYGNLFYFSQPETYCSIPAP